MQDLPYLHRADTVAAAVSAVWKSEAGNRMGRETKEGKVMK